MAVMASVFDDTQRATLEALCDTFVPAVQSDTGDPVEREFLARSAGDMQIAAQMEAMLGDNGVGVSNAVAALEQAERTFERETSRARYLSDAAHELSYGEQLPALEAAERHAVAMAQVAEQNARMVRRQLNDLAGPVLTETEMTAASARAAVVQIEVDRASLATVLASIRRSIATQDRPQMYLYYQLLNAAPPKTRPAVEGASGVPLPPDEREEAERAELRRLIARIGDELRSTEFDPIRKRADEALERAVTAGIRARKRRQVAAIEADYTSRGFVPIPPEAA